MKISLFILLLIVIIVNGCASPALARANQEYIDNHREELKFELGVISCPLYIDADEHVIKIQTDFDTYYIHFHKWASASLSKVGPKSTNPISSAKIAVEAIPKPGLPINHCRQAI